LVWSSRDKEKKDEDKRGVNYPAISGGVGNVVVSVLVEKAVMSQSVEVIGPRNEKPVIRIGAIKGATITQLLATDVHCSVSLASLRIRS
jgi:hypothetical protein